MVQVERAGGVQHLLPDGHRQLGVLGQQLAASRGWTQGTWTAPAVPSGATAVSFGLALNSGGTMATTRYSLAPVRYTSTRLIAFLVPVAAAAIALFGVRRFRRPRAPAPP